MQNRQFVFSLFVAALLSLLGSLVATFDPIGWQLVVVGTALGTTGIFTKCYAFNKARISLRASPTANLP